MKKNRFFLTFFLLGMLLVFSTSCKKEVCDQAPEADALVSGTAKSQDASVAAARNAETPLLRSLRAATSRFHSTTQAIREGHEPDDHCVAVPGLGGMGYHWVNRQLVDPVFEPLKPEAILYANGPNGNLKLVAVEYIVVNVGQARPMFDSKPFDIGGTPLPVPHWSLHVWIHEDNPSGLFTPFNPNIACP